MKGVISNDLELTWVTIRWHEASRGLSATAELLITFVSYIDLDFGCIW